MRALTNIRLGGVAGKALYSGHGAGWSLRRVARHDRCLHPCQFPAQPLTGWRTPAVILLCGCLISLLTFGPRSTLGFFLTPLSQANGWGRDVFALALAIQNLLWGIGQPFCGRDRRPLRHRARAVRRRDALCRSASP